MMKYKILTWYIITTYMFSIFTLKCYSVEEVPFSKYSVVDFINCSSYSSFSGTTVTVYGKIFTAYYSSNILTAESTNGITAKLLR